MKNSNYEITLNNSPYYIRILNELFETLNKKRKILSKIRFNDEKNSILSFEERHLLKHLNLREEELLQEIIALKGWNCVSQTSFENHKINEASDFDEYQNTII